MNDLIAAMQDLERRVRQLRRDLWSLLGFVTLLGILLILVASGR